MRGARKPVPCDRGSPQSLASPRHRLSHAMVRATIHGCGRTTKVCNSLRLTTSMIQLPLRDAAGAARASPGKTAMSSRERSPIPASIRTLLNLSG